MVTKNRIVDNLGLLWWLLIDFRLNAHVITLYHSKLFMFWAQHWANVVVLILSDYTCKAMCWDCYPILKVKKSCINSLNNLRYLHSLSIYFEVNAHILIIHLSLSKKIIYFMYFSRLIIVPKMGEALKQQSHARIWEPKPPRYP